MDKFERQKMSEQTRREKEREESAAFNRVLFWIGGGVVLEFLLLLLNRFYNNYRVEEIGLATALRPAVKIAAVVALVVTVVLALLWRRARTGKKGGLLFGALALFAGGLSVSCFITWAFGPAGLKSAYVLVPIAIVLAFVYYLYQREFFLVASMSALAMLGVWFAGKGLGGAMKMVVYAYVVLVAVVLVLSVLLVRKLQTGDGVISLRGKRVRLFGQEANYPLLYVSAAIAAAVLVCSLFTLPAVFLYGVMAAWLLIMAVYYTVKMM